MSVTQTAGEGPLSIDAATSLLTATPEIEEQPAPEESADAPSEDEETEEFEESEAEPTADDADGPEEDTEGELEEPSDPETPVIAAPQSWAAHERAVFATLPKQAQEIVLARETERDKAVSRAQSEAGQVRKAAQAELEQLASLKPVLEDAVTRANEVFAGKWGGINWPHLARTDPNAYVAAKAEYEAEQAELQQVREAERVTLDAEEKARNVQFQGWLSDERQKLSQIAPELVDPKEGPGRLMKVNQFLLDQGCDPASLRQISAAELSVAYDAMQYREGRSAAKAATASAPARKPISPPARAAAPTAAPAPVTQQKKGALVANARFQKSGSIDDAVAYLNAKG